MYFKIAFSAVAVTAALTGCGVLGDRDDSSISKLIKAGRTDCINEFGPQFEAYLTGTANLPKWADTFDCTIDTLKLFRQFVKGSVPDGYNQADMQSFVGKFLFTSKPISAELIAYSFKLKASLIGGSDQTLTYDEIETFTKLLRIGQEESLRLYPFLVRIIKDSSDADYDEKLKAYRKALMALTDSIADGIPVGTRPSLKTQDLIDLIEEVKKLHAFTFDTRYLKLFGIGKALLAGGTSDQIRSEEWKKILSLAGNLGGVADAWKRSNPYNLWSGNKVLQFTLDLISIVKETLGDSMKLHGGTYNFALLDEVIDNYPEDDVSKPGMIFNGISRAPIKIVLRPLVRKVFEGGESAKGLNQKALDKLYEIFSEWVKGDIHLDKIFVKAGVGTDPARTLDKTEFKKSAYEYRAELSSNEQKRVDRMITIVDTHPVMFRNDDNQITFEHTDRLSLNHLKKLHWMRLGAERFFQVYSTDSKKEYAFFQDVCSLSKDFRPILDEFAVFDPTRPFSEYSRYGEARMFTFLAKGQYRGKDDKQEEVLDVDEAANYVAYLFSIANLSHTYHGFMEKESGCEMIDIDASLYPGLKGVEANCYRKSFFDHWDEFMTYFDGMREYYNNLTFSEKIEMQKFIEIASRDQYYNRPFTRYDSERLGAILHYVETVLQRYDTDEDEGLERHEADAPFEVFEALFSTNDFLKKKRSRRFAAFTYTLKNGVPPDEKKPGPFILWIWQKNQWSFYAHRKRIFQIFASMNAQAAQFARERPNDVKKCNK